MITMILLLLLLLILLLIITIIIVIIRYPRCERAARRGGAVWGCLYRLRREISTSPKLADRAEYGNNDYFKLYIDFKCLIRQQLTITSNGTTMVLRFQMSDPATAPSGPQARLFVRSPGSSEISCTIILYNTYNKNDDSSYTYIYIYIYIQRERDMYIYIYIYI